MKIIMPSMQNSYNWIETSTLWNYNEIVKNQCIVTLRILLECIMGKIINVKKNSHKKVKIQIK